ncbi:amino acid adenylation domain-containing protein [Catenulispora sp. NL8]|uniref:Amino acid adenylation domain-containing protein n=1 Tax=Catenulispora pinistramenti TaxID=2705254 RepID=A0ABS5L019_9ACTN|nr:non-ribosomal peptide synthetase [Catenulispora pinistramenti]MBS2551683.1 amino acid adenylation domain-containing protein [Catenulispora pinistramenti]
MTESLTSRPPTPKSAPATALDLALLARQGAAERPDPRARRTAPDAEAPLSCGQERMWLVEQMAQQTGVSNYTFLARLRGRLDLPALERAVSEIQRRHEILRTVFAIRDGVPVQRVTPARPVSLPPRDLSGYRPERWERARRVAREIGGRRYRLTEEPAVRWELLRLDADEHVLVLGLHHAVADAWSEALIRRELSALYGAFHTGRPSPLPEPESQYADYATRQRRQLADGEFDQRLAALTQRLTGAPVGLALPGGAASRAGEGTRGETEIKDLDTTLITAAGEVAAAENVSLFMVLLAAFAIVLARGGGQDDIVIGIPVAGRLRLELENLIGFFVNTIALRLDLSGDPTFRELLARVRDVALDAYADQDVPFERVVEQLRPAREPGRQPVVQALFQLINTPEETLELPGLDASWEQLFDPSSSLDLSVSLQPSADGLTGFWSFRTAMLETGAVRRMQGHFENVLRTALADPGTRIGDIDLVGARERQLLTAWGTGPANVGGDLVHEQFRAQARRTPDAVAVTADGVSTTYRRLNELSDRLAGHLRAAGLGPGGLAGVFLPRGLDAMVAILAVLKAGGGYLPLDTGYPAERIALMLEDAAPVLVVTDAAFADALPPTAARPVLVGDAYLDLRADPVIHLSALAPDPEDIAYVIYTSGSTGRPKGTAVTHRSLIHHLAWTREGFVQEGRHGTLVHSSLGFDFTVTPLFLSLLSGKETVMVTEQDTISALAEELLRTDRDYSWIKLTPTHLDALRFHLPAGARITSVRTIVAGGEALRREAVLAWRALAPGIRVINEYGPTETTVGVVVHPYAPADLGEAVPIGKPVRSSTAYVLDSKGRPAPIGVVGELFIGGDVLARGYLGRPGLTAQRFVPDPFAAGPGARMYRTGDLARWREDGELDFLGRIDDQVKIRGHRVELGEIEAALVAHPGVLEAVATVRERDGEKTVVAYWVPDSAISEPADPAALRSFLRGRLPDYMLPAAFHQLAEIPSNAHGKADRSRLPEVSAGRADWSGPYAQPRTVAERVVTEVWAEVLGLDRVGVTDDFFVLGGDSLSAARMAAVLAIRTPGADVATVLRAVFREPTPASMAAELDSASTQVSGPVRTVRTDWLPLSSGQRSMWFHEQLVAGSTQYLSPIVLRLSGRLDVELLRASVERIVARHEVLRTGIRKRDGEPVGIPLSPTLLRFAVEEAPPGADPAVAADELIAEELATPFVVRKELPVRARLLRTGPDEWLFVLSFHHAATDAASKRVVLDELATGYRAALAGTEPELPELRFQYADYAAWSNSRIADSTLEPDVAFWREQLAGLSVADLPFDHACGPDRSAAMLTGTVDAATCQALRAVAAREGATYFMVLTAAFRLVLAGWSGEEDLAIGTPVSVRAAAGAEGLVGLFVNTVVLRARCEPGTSFAELVRAEKTTAAEAYAHQEVPFDLLVRELRPPRPRHRNPLFQVVHAHAEARGPLPELPGLRAEPVALELRETAFDLSLETETTPAGTLESTFIYPRAAFAPETVADLAERWVTLLTEIAATNGERLS